MEWARGQCIGSGSFSRVHLATLKQHPSVLAVKSCAESDTSLLENERAVVTELGSCPQIIQYFGDSHTVEENNERLYNLLLEYAKGGSLSQKLNKFGCFRERDVKDYARSILKGLRHIHAKGFVHCDLKLDNILLFENEEVKIADFGLARKAGKAQGRAEIRGTPLYMAPESVNDNAYESGVDIWALGCAVIEMLTGKPAWSCKPGTNMFVLLIRIGKCDELPTIPEELSQQGKDFLSKCFVKDPKRRWTADMLLEHPFVADQGKGTAPSGEEIEVSSTSPTCHFDFPDWVSIQSPSPRSEFLSDDGVGLVFPSLNSSSWISAADRIRQLASDQCCNWSDSGFWVALR
ncbi:mitogen-activated protein kinase kinase kinase 17-like [Populus alba x Populus x berolinensis]|uniref:Mitogen-activated protein kinase kinase kinase 17-like n=1 Tax=Populus alba x Populus x berolinensis TaxID=444605 RepID=A0AAD6QVC5_9ROSI|nr:mitogen-activated protein kinase kinase kinase 17-like [Populus alba x Populus x berolinensis]